VIHIHICMDEKWSIFMYIWMKNDPHSTIEQLRDVKDAGYVK
jgi:hypothetical protein